MILTKQPPTVPDRLKEGHYLRLKGCVTDAEERGDQNALGIVSIGLIVIEKYTINCPGYHARVYPCRYYDEQYTCLASVMVLLGDYHNVIVMVRMKLVSLDLDWYEWWWYNILFQRLFLMDPVTE